MLFHDRATIEGKARITREGYLVADAYVALANNVQTYRKGELPGVDRDLIVFRPEAEVFARDSVASASRLPITLDHPSVMVDATNWREYGKGETGEEIMRDGDRMRVPLRVMDAAAVQSMQSDRREFSLGYTAEIKMEPGTFTDAAGAVHAFDASLSSIRYNHLAACGAARGGPTLRIVDERTTINDGAPTVKKIMLDGLQVDLSDAAAVEIAINKIMSKLADAETARKTAENTVATHVTTIAGKDAEIATLKQAVTDAKVTPQQMRDAAAAYARTVSVAKVLAPTAAITDAMDEAAIKSAVVTAKLGDAAKGWTDAQFDVSFATMAAGVTDAAPDVLRDAISGQPLNVNDGVKAASDARDQMIKDMLNPTAAKTAA